MDRERPQRGQRPVEPSDSGQDPLGPGKPGDMTLVHSEAAGGDPSPQAPPREVKGSGVEGTAGDPSTSSPSQALPNEPRSQSLQPTAPSPASPTAAHAAVDSTQSGSRWGILVREEIERLGLIRVPERGQEDKECYKHASYDLRVGNEYVMIDSDEEGSELRVSDCHETLDTIRIPPFASVIVSTYELVHLPDNVAGRFDLRVHHALEGLIIKRGTQVEPGYRGQLFALLHNISNQPISLKFRDYESRLFTIEFSYTSGPTKPPENKKRGIKDFIPRSCARGGIDAVLNQMREMQDNLRSVSADFNAKKMMVFTGGVLLVIIATATIFIPLTLTKFTYDRDYFPIVNARAIAAMSQAKATEPTAEAIARSLLSEIEAEGSMGERSLQERIYVDRLLQLLAKRDSLEGDPSRRAELKTTMKQIDQVIELLRKQ